MAPVRRRTPARLGAGLVAVGAVVLALAVPADLAAAEPAPAPTPAPTRHSSDGVRGPLLRDAAGAGRRVVAPLPAPERAWPVAAGVSYREWTVTLRQGAVRLHLLTADLDTPGVGLDLVSGATTQARAPFSRLLAAAGGRAGVNADFFDISDTGAPLGVGRERRRGLLHGPRTGWNNTVTVAADGTPSIGTTSVTGEVRRRGVVVTRIAGLNDPTLVGDEIGAYTSAWGASPGRRVVDGATRVRQVVVSDGRVRSSTTRPIAGRTIRGTLLVGRGQGAAVLRRLKKGQRVRIDTRAGRAGDRVVVGGSVPLLRGGSVVTTDDGELHPRTAFGYSTETREVLLLVADGRTEASAGLTLRQLASQLRGLGAEEALNLDGGGSSTLVAPDAAGVVGVRNHPSSGGRERSVPNGLQVRWAW